MEKEILLLTKSARYNGYCVAGIDLTNRQFIRLMSKDIFVKGSLTDRHMQFSNGEYANVLDVVKVDVVEHRPTKIQTENYLINENSQWNKIRTARVDELTKYVNTDIDFIFKNTHEYLNKEEAEEIHHSILLVEISNVYFNTNGYNKTKISFFCKNEYYSKISMTDPEYFDSNMRLDKALIVFTLPDDAWCNEHNQYYKYAAKVFDIA